MGRKLKWNAEKGQKLNRLTVIETYKSKGKIRAICECECGGKTDVCSYIFLTGRSKSCGCLREELNRNRQKDNRGRKASGEVGKNMCFSKIKRSASLRKIEFNLTKEQVLNLCTKNCFYCDTKPTTKALGKQAYRKYSQETFDHCQFLYNGLDRIDSSKGYDIDNVVTCCGFCNIMKLDHNLKEWLERIEKIANRKQLIIDTILKT